ncbi:MAG: UDP-N-acetylmuramoyl-L-alanyl-D-glutamate--2,6-diaminopimelate ligase [Candidatus Liptonbacteria bacterium]|nr:UDP-N-acetylmuramoyl-L-alanyl-D-glutamate--2,6-diaminopimelate ligase [Candidatus Liptonbacteria bacterium]
MVKKIIRRCIPEHLLNTYHWCKAHIAAFTSGHPSREMIVIGVTGTKGKSSVANLLWAGLTGAGMNVGVFSTANIRIGREELLNPYHMTMPNPFVLQRFLRRMARSGCDIAIAETTSEGILQYRHSDIAYDILVFTSLTPEHIERHKTFENYRAVKQIIFRELLNQPRKTIRGREVPKAIIVNADSPESPHFLKFPADRKETYGESPDAGIRAEAIKESVHGISFTVHMGADRRDVSLKLLGRFSAINALPAFAVGRILGLRADAIAHGLENLLVIPGRMEKVHERPLVIVDYAHEPESLRAALISVRALHPTGRILLVFGATGGGRDKAKRPVMGRIGANHADVLFVTNDDPFDENPCAIMEMVARGCRDGGKADDKDLFLIEDRRVAIRAALTAAHADDVVLIAGKGAEQILHINGTRMPWDDRRVVQEELSRK